MPGPLPARTWQRMHEFLTHGRRNRGCRVCSTEVTSAGDQLAQGFSARHGRGREPGAWTGTNTRVWVPGLTQRIPREVQRVRAPGPAWPALRQHRAAPGLRSGLRYGGATGQPRVCGQHRATPSAAPAPPQLPQGPPRSAPCPAHLAAARARRSPARRRRRAPGGRRRRRGGAARRARPAPCTAP